MGVNFSNFKILIKPSFLWFFFIGAFSAPLIAIGYLSSPDISKWVFVYSLTGICFLLISESELAYPSITFGQSIFIILILTLLSVNFILHHNSLLDKDFLDRILFWILFFSFLTSLKKLSPKRLDIIFLPLFLGTGVFLISAVFNVIFFKPYHSFTFGNINKSAEFVGLSLAIQLAFSQRLSGYMKTFLMALISLSLTYIYFSSCRSVMMATGIVMIYLISIKKISFKHLILIFFLSLTLVVLLSGIYQALEINLISVSSDLKGSSFIVRWEIVLNTLKLIGDHPWGVGIGRYPFAGLGYMKSLPGAIFDEGYYLFSPHNEFLRILAEDGVLVFVLGVLVFLSFFWPFKKVMTFSRQHPECASFFIFLFIQCLFQFPLIQPFPVLMISFMLAYTLYLYRPIKEIASPYIWIVYKFFGIVFLYVAGAMAYSITTLNTQTYNQDKAELSYTLWPNKEMLKKILFNAYITEDHEIVITFATQELSSNPYNVYAQKYLGLSLIEQGDLGRGCPLIASLKSVFHRTSDLDAMLLKKCK